MHVNVGLANLNQEIKFNSKDFIKKKKKRYSGIPLHVIVEPKGLFRPFLSIFNYHWPLNLINHSNNGPKIFETVLEGWLNLKKIKIKVLN